jgi:hypothetical protein
VVSDVYGERIGQGLVDAEWLRDAGDNGWVVLMKDDRIRHRPAEPSDRGPDRPSAQEDAGPVLLDLVEQARHVRARLDEAPSSSSPMNT